MIDVGTDGGVNPVPPPTGQRHGVVGVGLAGLEEQGDADFIDPGWGERNPLKMNQIAFRQRHDTDLAALEPPLHLLWIDSTRSEPVRQRLKIIEACWTDLQGNPGPHDRIGSVRSVSKNTNRSISRTGRIAFLKAFMRKRCIPSRRITSWAYERISTTPASVGRMVRTMSNEAQDSGP
jgi:hypothetical protein